MEDKELSQEQLEQVAAGAEIAGLRGIFRRREDLAPQDLALAGVYELADEDLARLAGGALDKDLANEWTEEVYYARFRLNMTLEEVMAALSQSEYVFSTSERAGLKGIAENIYRLK